VPRRFIQGDFLPDQDRVGDVLTFVNPCSNACLPAAQVDSHAVESMGISEANVESRGGADDHQCISIPPLTSTVAPVM
jgi:hypothetical protein